jgi:hypothetical protein
MGAILVRIVPDAESLNVLIRYQALHLALPYYDSLGARIRVQKRIREQGRDQFLIRLHLNHHWTVL